MFITCYYETLMSVFVQDQKKFELLQEAVKRQTEIMVDNILGQGVDIHLLGLREAAKDTSPTAASPLPELFTDETYKIANSFILSTSQVRSMVGTFCVYDHFFCPKGGNNDGYLHGLRSGRSRRVRLFVQSEKRLHHLLHSVVCFVRFHQHRKVHPKLRRQLELNAQAIE